MTQITIHPAGELTAMGRQYVAVAGGKVLATHYCSSDEFAKNDLGMYPPENTFEPSAMLARERRAKYDELFPDGWEISFSPEVFWIEW